MSSCNLQLSVGSMTDRLSVAKLYASDFGKRIIEKEGFVAMLRYIFSTDRNTKLTT